MPTSQVSDLTGKSTSIQYKIYRDCKKFDPVKRAKEIFNALDLNNDGAITEDEFVAGCKSDSCFMKVIDEMSSDFLWSTNIA